MFTALKHQNIMTDPDVRQYVWQILTIIVTVLTFCYIFQAKSVVTVLERSDDG